MRTLISVLILSLSSGACLANIDSLRNEANIAVAAGEFEVAAAKLRQIIELAPEDGATHYQLGTVLMDNGGDLFDAARHFEHAGHLNYQPLGVAYRLSRIYARTGRKDDALSQLENMARSGFSLPNLLQDEADYAEINQDQRFVAALTTISAARYPCESDERHHAFDFWIGDWNVTSQGQFAGTNSIKPILGHCTLLEQWTSSSGGLGKSFNYYDPGEDHWRQIWISDSGTFIEFTGVARDGGIYYTAETTNPTDGSVTMHKFEFTQIDNGAVRQYWQTSTDGGENWQVIWDGRYERAVEE